MEGLLPVIIPLVTAVLGSLITAGLLRRSSKEANDTNAFQVVTTQLFKLNSELRTELDEVKLEVKELRKADFEKEARIESLEEDLGTSKKVARALARYIGVLIQAWQGDAPPPQPDPPIDWQNHL